MKGGWRRTTIVLVPKKAQIRDSLMDHSTTLGLKVLQNRVELVLLLLKAIAAIFDRLELLLQVWDALVFERRQILRPLL